MSATGLDIETFLIRAVFDGEIQNADWESMNDVEAEVIASFPKHTVHLNLPPGHVSVKGVPPEVVKKLSLNVVKSPQVTTDGS